MLLGGVAGGNESHAAHHLDSRVGHDPEDRGSSQTIEVCILGQISIQQVESHASRYGYDDLFLEVEHRLNLIYNHFYTPRFNGDDDDISVSCRFHVIMGQDKVRIDLSHLLQGLVRLGGTSDIRGFEHGSFR